MNGNESKKRINHTLCCHPFPLLYLHKSSKVPMEMNWLNLWQDVVGSAYPQKPILAWLVWPSG